MKNNFYTSENQSKTYTSYFKNALLILLFVFSNKINSQGVNKSPFEYGLAIGTHVSGNAHGVLYSGLFNVANKRHMLGAGPSILKRNMKLVGAEISYSYMLCGPKCGNGTNGSEYLESEIADTINFDLMEEGSRVRSNGVYDDKLQLHFYSFLQYINNAPLSFNAEKLESHVNRIEGQNWNSVRLSTVDFGFGLQLKMKLAGKVVLKNYVGATFIYHTKYLNNMHHEKFMPTLTIGTAFEIPSIH
jgi:hypothetical protein